METLRLSRDRLNIHRDVERMRRSDREYPIGRPYQWGLNVDGSVMLRRAPCGYEGNPGEIVGFQVDLVVKRHVGQRGRRNVGREEIHTWTTEFFLRNAGLEVISVQATPAASPIFNKIALRFSGVGRIVDPAKFNQAVINGIGDGKAYGFGMLIPTNPPQEDER